MTYNSKTIKKHKGKLIALTYRNSRGYKDTITGEISASTRYKIIFNVNKSGLELAFDYKDLIEINEPEKS
jgi:hypothetical protein